MDERSDRGEFYPGGREGGVPPGTDTDKVDRVNLGELGESYTLKEVKNKVNQIVRAIAPAAVCIALAVVRLMSYAATAPLEDIPNTAPVVTNEEDAVAMAAVGALGAAVSNRVEAAEGALQAEIAGATNAVVQAALRAAEAESNRVDSTFAKRSEIPAAPDLAPYALKSELPQDYLTENDITNFATRAWISAQGYASEAGVGARLDAQDLAIDAATNAQNAAIAATGNRVTAATNSLWQAVGSESNRIDSATNEVWQSARRADETLQREIDALRIVAADSNAVTRLVTPDGTRWQDATGTVWQVQEVIGWSGTIWTNGQAYSAASTGVTQEVVFWPGPTNFAGAVTYTNAAFGTIFSDSGMSESWVWEAGGEGGSLIYNELPGPTNVFTLADIEAWQDFWTSLDLRLGPMGSVTSAVDRVAYTKDLATIVPGNYETVSNRAMTANNYTDEVAAEFEDGRRTALYADNSMFAQISYELGDTDTSYTATDLIRESTNAAIAVAEGKQDALPYPTNAIPYAAISGAPSDIPDMDDYATKDDAESAARSAASAAVEPVSNLVETVRAESALVYRLYQGSNVVAEVTNYNSSVHAPSLRLMQLNESNEYFTVWTETNGLTRTLAKANEYTDAAITNRAAPRAWSKVTAGLGFDAPSNTTWLSTGRTVIAGGLEPEKHVTSGGAIWLLESNGMTADFHPQTNNTAFINLSNADGTPIFRVEKTDSFLVGVHVDSVTVDGNELVCGVGVVAADHPLVRVKAQFGSGEWAKEEDGIPASLATVTWSGTTGNWTCRIANNTGGGTLFAQMEYLQEGGTKVVNTAPIDVPQGILCTDGIHKCRPVYSNGNITWEVVP